MLELADQKATQIAFSTKVIDDKIVKTDTVFKDSETGLTHVFDTTGKLVAQGYGDVITKTGDFVKDNKNLFIYGGLAAALAVAFVVMRKKRKRK